MDVKGIGIFLGLSYAAAWGMTWAAFNFGLMSFETGSLLHTILLLVMLNLPALFAFVAGQLGRGPVLAQVLPLPRVTALRVIVLVPVVFLIGNLAAVALGQTILDWRLGTLINKLETGTPLSPEVRAILPAFLIVVGSLLSMVLGATLVAGAVIGQVYAFHLFLLDRLRPLGTLMGNIAGGTLWALWWLPLYIEQHRFMGSFAKDGAVLAIGAEAACALVIAIALTALIRQAYERTGTLALALIVLGSFIAHAGRDTFSIWGYIFQIQHPPYTGVLGVYNAVLWGVLALFPGILVGGRETERVDPGPSAAADPAA